MASPKRIPLRAMNASAPTEYLATVARGLAPLLEAELRALHVDAVHTVTGGVAFTADRFGLYRVILGTRVASRVLLPLALFDEPDGDACYAAARAVDWPSLFALDARFKVDVTGRSAQIAHTNFAGLRVKDGIVDCFRDAVGARPDVDAQDPDVRVLLQLQGRSARLALDIGGGGLHRRGYRADGGGAPLRENLASALLLRAGWPEMAAQDGAFMDVFCGSGTLVIEAALMATKTAPGLLRDTRAPRGWHGHSADAWSQALREARAAIVPWPGPKLLGSDIDPAMVKTARSNARLAGMETVTDFRVADALRQQPVAPSGLLLSNPPYGERLGTHFELVKLYSLLGEHLRRAFGGWQAALLVADDADSQRLGLRASHRHQFHNGALACHLLQFDIHALPEGARSAPAPDFANRLAKNQRHLARWARRRGVSNYRLYDAELPEYPLVVDRYEAEDGTLHLHAQEFAAPKTVEPARAEARLRGALAALVEGTGVTPGQLHYKQRRAQKGSSQYRKSEAATPAPFWVVEHGCRLRVDLDAYLDSGLFLDHRPMRLRLQQECSNLRLLNLFCYTAAVSVHAAVGGARQTVSVDRSNTYLDWAKDNFAGNGIRAERADGRERAPPGTHALLRADVMPWLIAAQAQPYLRFDRIFCDPPTFSNSKDDDDFDIQRDHVALIEAAAALLAPEGVLYFSTNRRRFRLDDAALSAWQPREITAQTLDEDCKRPPPAHRCWMLTGGSFDGS